MIKIIKNLPIIILSVAVCVIFCFIDKFSLLSLIILIANFGMLYLFVYRDNFDLLSYILIFALCVINYNLLQNSLLPWSSISLGIIAGAIFFFISLKNYQETFIKYIYSFSVFIIFCELGNVINYFNFGGIAKSIFILIFFYLLGGLIKLTISKHLNSKELIKHSAVFGISLLLLFLNINVL